MKVGCEFMRLQYLKSIFVILTGNSSIVTNDIRDIHTTESSCRDTLLTWITIFSKDQDSTGCHRKAGSLYHPLMDHQLYYFWYQHNAIG